MELLRVGRKGTTNCCYVMTLHSKKKLEESLVREALVHFAKRQPLLRAVLKTVSIPCLFGQKIERYFEIVKLSKVEEVIDLTTCDVPATKWQKEWYEIVRRPIETSLLWRTFLFTEEYLTRSDKYVNTILFRANHCIVDGVSGMKLCKQFLACLNSLSDVPRTSCEDIPSFELLPSFHDLVKNTRSCSTWSYFRESLVLTFIYKFIRRLNFHISLASKPEKLYDFFMSRPSSEPRDLIYKVFSETETLRIRQSCTSHGTTVTGALVAAAHEAFCKIIETQSLYSLQKFGKQHDLTHNIAINGLRVCEPKPPADYLGNFVFIKTFPIPYNSKRSKGYFWSLALEVTRRIKTIVKEGKYVSEYLADYDFFSPREIMEEFISPLDPLMKFKLFADNYISSTGAFTYEHDDTKSTPEFKLHECLHYVIPFGYPSFSNQYNATVNGKMSWVITCSDYVPHDIEKQFASYCFDTLLQEAC